MADTAPTFSIITPVLNGARYLPHTIASVQAQTDGDYEHIIIDGGSSDGTIDIARTAAAGDSRIRFHLNPGQSQYQAIDWGIERAEGAIISWLNADDLYAPWALASLKRYRRVDAAAWMTGLPACWHGDGTLNFVRADAWRPRGAIARGWYHGEWLGFIQQEAIFFTRTLYDRLDERARARFASSRLAGDFLLWKMFAAYEPLTVVPALLGGFRRHQANRSVAGMADYMAEAQGFGAAYPPPLIGPFIARFMRAVSAYMTARRAILVDRLLQDMDDQSGAP